MLLLHGHGGQDQTPVREPADGAIIGIHAVRRPITGGGRADRQHADLRRRNAEEMLGLVQRHLIGRHGEDAAIGIQVASDLHRREIGGSG